MVKVTRVVLGGPATDLLHEDSLGFLTHTCIGVPFGGKPADMKQDFWFGGKFLNEISLDGKKNNCNTHQ